ncbi:MAG TPA: cysteine methyltransferase [Porphyromonadaceae bacterium]|nr:cysteine methyltransferase [Porphyromonadaceae bacterium]
MDNRIGPDGEALPDTVVISEWESPCGKMIIGSIGEYICLCDWVESKRRDFNDRRIMGRLGVRYSGGMTRTIRRAIDELEEYFAGERKSFDVPLLMVGTDLQKQIWSALCEIPYGETRTYKEISEAVGHSGRGRGCAGQVASNPISILVPCHRVIGSNGSLTGYAGGLDAKQYLLDLEARYR